MLSCCTELSAYYRNRTFSNSQATLHSFSERCETCHIAFNGAPQYISYKHDMHEPIRYVLDHLDERQLIWYGSKVPRERESCELNFTPPLLVFVIIGRFFSSSAFPRTENYSLTVLNSRVKTDNLFRWDA